MAMSFIDKLKAALLPDTQPAPDQNEALYNALGVMGVMPDPATIRKNPVISNEFLQAHPALGEALNRALWAAEATPSAPPVSGAGNGIARTVAGIMGGPEAQAAYEAGQAMQPMEALSNYAKMRGLMSRADLNEAQGRYYDALPEHWKNQTAMSAASHVRLDKNGKAWQLGTDGLWHRNPNLDGNPAIPQHIGSFTGNDGQRHEVFQSPNGQISTISVGKVRIPASQRGGLTPGEAASGKRAQQAAASRLETWKGQQYAKAQNFFTKTFERINDPNSKDNGSYLNKSTGQTLTPDQYNKLMYGAYQQIENNYAAARNQLGLPTQTYKYPELSGQPNPAPNPSGNSGTVKMRAPNGQIATVPRNLIDHYKSMGAKVIQ